MNFPPKCKRILPNIFMRPALPQYHPKKTTDPSLLCTYTQKAQQNNRKQNPEAYKKVINHDKMRFITRMQNWFNIKK